MYLGFDQRLSVDIDVEEARHLVKLLEEHTEKDMFFGQLHFDICGVEDDHPTSRITLVVYGDGPDKVFNL